VTVALRVPADKIGYAVENGTHKGQLRVAVFYGDSKGHYLGVEWKRYNLAIPDALHKDFLQSPVEASIPVPLKAARQVLKVIVYDVESDRVGSMIIKLP
jgi:hypothetical protein